MKVEFDLPEEQVATLQRLTAQGCRIEGVRIGLSRKRGERVEFAVLEVDGQALQIVEPNDPNLKW